MSTPPGSLRDSPALVSHLPSKSSSEAGNLPLLLGVGLAALCSCLLLGCCVICWRWHRKRQGGKGEAWLPSGLPRVELGPALPSSPVTAVAIQQQGAESGGEALDSQPPQPAASPPQSLRRGRASLPSIPLLSKQSPAVAPVPSLGRRCTISGGSAVVDNSRLLPSPRPGTDCPPSCPVPEHPSSAGAKPRPRLHFALFHSEPEAMLVVTVIGASRLPKGFRAGRDAYVKVSLLPESAEPRRTALHRGSLNPAFHERFHFARYSLAELRGLTLRFAVYVKGFHRLKDLFVGEVMFPCAQGAWERRVPSTYTQELSTTKTKLRKSLSCQNVSTATGTGSPSFSQPKSAGQLFLLLQYQALANRIKVLVRKAENLGRLTRMPGAPGHYVTIRLCHNGKILDTKETKSIAGCSPVWNSPFLFRLPAGDISEHPLSLEFTVMQARLYTRGCVVGRVLIGPDAPEMGQTHWKEMCSRGNVESARWHAIQPEGLQLCP